MEAALEADAGSEDCAICFDPVHAEDRLPLPCRCQLTYCLLCWDRALAAAFNDNGQARCPSCRRPVRVDFVCHNRVRTPDSQTPGRSVTQTLSLTRLSLSSDRTRRLAAPRAAAGWSSACWARRTRRRAAAHRRAPRCFNLVS